MNAAPETDAIIIGAAYRSLNWERLWTAISESAVLSSLIMLIIGFSQVMGWLFAIEQVPQAFAAGILASIDTRTGFLLFVIALLVIIGCFMEASPAKIILLPLLLPVADAFGIDRIQFGLVITLALLIGIATPPLGVGLYLMSAVAKVPFQRLSIAILPLLIPPLAILFLISFFPGLSLWLPNYVLGPG